MLHYYIPLHEKLSHGVHTVHVVKSGGKNVTSQQRSASNGAGSFTAEKTKKRPFFLFLPMQPAGIRWLPCHIHKGHYFFFLSVASVHVQFIQKVRQHSLKVNHSTVAHNRSFSITTQLQYLWELLLMERLFRCLPPSHPPPHLYLPFSFVVLILFCGLILMKSLVVNRSGILRACNFHNTVTWITMSWWS